MIAGLLRRRNAPAERLHTARLWLIPITRAMLEAETESTAASLAALLQAVVPPGWPPSLWEPAVWMHMATQLEAQPETAGWHRYMITANTPHRLIGCLGGFPGAHGDAELGYSVVAAEQGKGFASEAVEMLMRWLLQQPAVRSVSAQAWESSGASVRVMQRCGMVCVGPGDEAGTVRYRRWKS